MTSMLINSKHGSPPPLNPYLYWDSRDAVWSGTNLVSWTDQILGVATTPRATVPQKDTTTVPGVTTINLGTNVESTINSADISASGILTRFELRGPYTFSARMKCFAIPATQQSIFCFCGASATGLDITAAGLVRSRRQGSTFTLGGSISTTVWKTYTTMYDGTNLSSWVDDVQTTTQSQTTNVLALTRICPFGNFVNNTVAKCNAIGGAVGVWDRALNGVGEMTTVVAAQAAIWV